MCYFCHFLYKGVISTGSACFKYENMN